MRAKPYRLARTHQAVDGLAVEGRGAESLLPLLQQVQANVGCLAPDVLGAVSDELHIMDARTHGVASFYSMLANKSSANNVIRVCDGPVCALLGCQKVRHALHAAVPNSDYSVERTSCLGLCDRAPAALVNLDPCGPLTPRRAGELLDGWRGHAPSYFEPRSGEVRVALKRLGHIDPGKFESAAQAGAYQALGNAIAGTPAQVLRVMEDSGLRGCGGAGFPTARKWQIVALQVTRPKYIVCNADESEPATFKDRVLMEEDPHLLLEGMALAGYSVGADTGYIYIRGEYETAAQRLERAICQAEQCGWLGENIQGSGFTFRVHVHRGAGAYICGEETALLESLEGRRGEPRIRPPYPTTRGFRGHPTVINNVETLCKVPAIVLNGPDWFHSIGTPGSPGTKLFTVTGHVEQPGLFEAPMGITLRQVIGDFAGGMKRGSQFKMALTGGAAGTVVGQAALDVPLDFASDRKGVSLGAGSIFVCNESISVASLLGWLVHFFEAESCGKCTPCREGTRELRLVLDRLRNGHWCQSDIDELKRLSRMLRVTSFCGLGQSVAWPIDSALNHFPHEFS